VKKTIVVPQNNELLCSFKNSSHLPCGLYASTEAVYVVPSEDGYLDEVSRKFCQPHATKFAIIAPRRVRFFRIPMPEVKS
jgi:hypothetical protein